MTSDPWAALVSLEGVSSALAAARDGIDVVLRDRGLRRTTPETTAESLLRGAHASAVLEGSASDLDAVREGRGDAVAVDAVRLSTQLLAQVPVLGRAPLQALARLHAVAAAGTLGPEGLGRPRSTEAAEVLRSLGALLAADQGSAPALLVAAVVHADLATSAPFASHNGLVARAAERLVLVARGVDPPSVVVPEAGHLALREAYASNLRAWASGTPSGRHAWLLYAAEAYAAGAEASPLRRAAR